MALTDSLISYWPMDEASGNALDAHGSNPLPEVSGTIGSIAGKVGTARDLEFGDTEYFEIVDNADLSTGDIDFTIAAWVKIESFAAAACIANKGWVGVDANSEWILYYAGVRFAFSKMVNTTQADVTANNFGDISLDTWYFVVAWHDSVNNLIGISVNNGTPNTTSTSTGVNNGTGTFQVGTALTLYWDGPIDEVGFWKRVLMADERTALYNGGNGLAYGDFVESSDAPAGFLGGGFGGLIIGA